MTSIYKELMAIKSKAILISLQAKLEPIHLEAAGPKSASVKMTHDYVKANFKSGGIAYYRELCLSHANAIVDRASARRHVNLPSEETLAWGGFLGGEILHWNDADALEAAEAAMIKTIIAATHKMHIILSYIVFAKSKENNNE
jgi:hypothetical protein